MTKISAAKKTAESPMQPTPSQNDSAHGLFLQYVEMSLYGGMGGGARLQSVYPNPPIQMPPDDGEHMTEYLRKRVSDIESGKVKMESYTFDEYMRYLDKIWSDQ